MANIKWITSVDKLPLSEEEKKKIKKAIPKKKKKEEEEKEELKIIQIPEVITVRELAELLDVSPTEIIAKLMQHIKSVEIIQNSPSGHDT